MTSTDSSVRHFSIIDKFIIESDRVLRTLNKNAHLPAKPSPAETIPEATLSTNERQHASGLMRINHTGEVCAQALYQGQALTAKLPDVRQEMELAAQEEVDHLHWCNERLKELNSRPSVLNPFFYGASFSIGALAGAVSDKVSLGFVAATEELVCRHLESHLQELPEADNKSRVVVEQMLEDEARHRQTALDAGGSDFPAPVKMGMKLLSKVMTKTTYRI